MSRKYSEMKDEKETESERNGDTKEKTNKPFNYKRLLALSYPERWYIAAGMVALVLSSSINLLLIAMVGGLVDSITSTDPDEGHKTLNRTVMFLSFLFVFGAVLSFFRAMLFTVAGERVATRLRRELFNHIIEQDIAFFDEHRTGEIVSRLADDCGALQNACTTNISMLLRNLVTLIGSLLNIFFISWRLTGVMLSVVPILAIGAVRYGKFVKTISKKVQDATSAATTAAEENLSNVRTVRSFCGEGNAQSAYAEKLHASFLLARKRAYAYGSFTAGIFLVGNFGLILVLWYGGTLVLSQTLTVGDLTSFALFTVGIAAALGIITSLYNDFMKGIGASQRVFELLDRQAAIPIAGGDHVLAHMKGTIEFVGVTFAYPSRKDQSVLQDVSLRVEAGQTVAMVGPSGGGKSTVAALVKRFYDPDMGTILVDGVDLKSLDRASYMKHVASVMQEPILFATSIRANITYGLAGHDKASDSQVEDAARSSNAWEFISRFADGLNTMVGERGVRLSGGQKQRIAIARALIKKPTLLILDEATSALDAESEALVQEAIDRLIQEHVRTTMVIAHRLSTIRNSDSILVIESGRLAQQGTHDELLKQCGVYSQLIAKQIHARPLPE